ncbi:MAG TPA: serine O-acetyltransferase EpsC [Dehalococcoidia bacterium]|nr:serine O-acetyltransferase EpsC [Dehalococcoidia bacterium]
MGWFSAIREDIRAAQTLDPAARGATEILLTYPGVHALIIHRLAQAIWRTDVPLLPRLISHLGRLLTGIEIHPGAQIGQQLFIDHGMGVVIGETTVIGDNCHLFQGVTLGGTSTRHEKRHPTLEENVVVGAGAKIIGAITIGANSMVGAGSVVVSNVPPNATVVGIPAHVIAYTNRSNETTERLPDPEWDRIDGLEQRLTQLEQRLAKPSTDGPARAPGNRSDTTPAEPERDR